MVLHFVTLSLIVASLLLLGIAIGKRNVSKKIGKKIPKGFISQDDADEFIDSTRVHCGQTTKNSGIIFSMAATVLVISALYFCVSYLFVRKHYIDGWREGRIIESVEYTYDEINGEKILKDSTFNYKTNREK